MEFIEILKGQGQQFNPAIKKGAMVLFFSDGCGHCNVMKPQWNALQNKIDELNNELEGPNIVSVNIEAANELENKWQEHTRSVPTILIVKQDGECIDYNGDRTTDKFMEFMKTHLSKKNHSPSHRHRRSKHKHKHKHKRILIGGGRKTQHLKKHKRKARRSAARRRKR